MEYLNFAIEIGPRQGDVYGVSVASPAGDARSSFTLPFAMDQVASILESLDQAVRGAGQGAPRDAARALAVPHPSVEEVGERLFAALFSGSVRVAFDQSLGMIHGKDAGLRIKICLDPEEPSLMQLASLPWEFLYRRETRDWLNLSRFTPVVRYLDVPRPHTPLELRPPLSILVVMAQPEGSGFLDLAKERKGIESTWATLDGVEVEFLESTGPEALAARLVQKPYHVLHYMGHGDFDECTGSGVLLLRDEDGRARPIDGTTLGILLRDVPTLRLAVLNACNTARLAKEGGIDPFAGVASALVMAGLPAVVAMQFPISDGAAIAFARRLYALLANGEAVDTAVAEGRRAILVSRTGTLEWGTPVLFMRAADGVIFQPKGAARREMAEHVPPAEESEAGHISQTMSAGERATIKGSPQIVDIKR